MSGRWVDLREAAELLGTSTDAVRKRAARGSLHSDRQDGRVLVWVDDGRTEGGREAQVDGYEALVEELRDRVRSLERRMDEDREARRRADTIIAQLRQANAALATKVPELEASASPEPPGASERVVEEPESSSMTRAVAEHVTGGLLTYLIILVGGSTLAGLAYLQQRVELSFVLSGATALVFLVLSLIEIRGEKQMFGMAQRSSYVVLMLAAITLFACMFLVFYFPPGR